MVHFCGRRSTAEEGEEEERGLRRRWGRFGWIAVFAYGAFSDDLLPNRLTSFASFVVGLASWWFSL
jgi:hypothetical protein